MAKEDKFADEMLSNNELDKVSGGGITDIARDGMQLYLYGKLSFEDAQIPEMIAATLYGMGYRGYKQTKPWADNVYVDRSGNKMKGPDFWKKFGEENGLSILKDREEVLAQKKLLCIANITDY